MNRRRPLSIKLLATAIREILTSKVAFGFTLVSGLSSGIFLAYLSSAQQILGQQFGFGELFALVFAALAAVIGLASFINAKIVINYGMLKILKFSLMAIVVVSLIFIPYAITYAGNPPRLSFLIYLAIVLFCIGLLFGNANSLAMEPLGHIAGIGAAIVGSFSILISLPIGILIAHAYSGTILPILFGFLTTMLLSLQITFWATKDSNINDLS